MRCYVRPMFILEKLNVLIENVIALAFSYAWRGKP